MPDEAQVRLLGELRHSRANGPGLRRVIWFQGCTLACRGCFNPQSHAAAGGTARSVAELIADIAAQTAEIDGVTVSGGEPMQQPRALAALLRGVRTRTGLSTLVFSGYRLAEIEAEPARAVCLADIDVLIAGRYVPARHHGHGLLGSANQTVHYLTGRYGPDDLAAVPPAEIVIDAQGRVSVTGVAPPMLAAR